VLPIQTREQNSDKGTKKDLSVLLAGIIASTRFPFLPSYRRAYLVPAVSARINVPTSQAFLRFTRSPAGKMAY
jgi:hypothetical protein